MCICEHFTWCGKRETTEVFQMRRSRKRVIIEEIIGTVRQRLTAARVNVKEEGVGH